MSSHIISRCDLCIAMRRRSFVIHKCVSVILFLSQVSAFVRSYHQEIKNCAKKD